MTIPKSLEYSADLQEFAISEAEYLRQHPEYNVLVTGAVVFNREGKLLLVQRAADEIAFADFWEIPGGKVDDTDETILHAAARELKEEAGLEATRVVRKVAQFTFESEKAGRPKITWLKFIFEVQVDNADTIVLDPVEHQHYVFASEEEVVNEQVGEVKLKYVSPENKAVKLAAFRARREALSS
ncbi:cutinase transcription factor 1 alpha [Curvularia clavata]|uniref:Cutinase transcription factor 1 alpha n=1 Tax=Curvularia clavata TaxID=95742 RepID=A0A9Q8Z938_CURCL|nr:cutinase transcription factor 1 alpha [Curvularia clavata]